MKKGISLIVLVITIIVLAILAGAIIISVSSTNVIKESNTARSEANKANAKAALVAKWADVAVKSSGIAEVSVEQYKAALTDAGLNASDFEVYWPTGVATTSCPSVRYATSD